MKYTSTTVPTDAVDALSKSKSVYEWNKIREELKKKLTNEQINKIDSQGLIGIVARKNGWAKKVN